MNDLITIDLGKLDKEKATDLIIAENGSLAREAEEELRKILDTQVLIEKMIEYIKERMGEEMAKRKLIKVKGSSITIGKRVFGTRYTIGDATPEEFVNQVVYNKPNAEAIDDFLVQNEVLPEGVELRDRAEKVSIVRRDEDV